MTTTAVARLGLAVAVAAAVLLALQTWSGGPRTVHVVIEHSRFLLPDGATALQVVDGQTVRFVVDNRDPIDHELIAGPLATQLRHEAGTDRHHDGAHGAVSVPAGATATTEHTFRAGADAPRPGTAVAWLGCHLPGHWDHGMRLPVELR